MTRWSRIPTRIAEEASPDDWIIVRDGWKVGRTYLRPASGGRQRWFWATWTAPARSGDRETLAEALEAVRAAATTDPTPSVVRVDRTTMRA